MERSARNSCIIFLSPKSIYCGGGLAFSYPVFLVVKLFLQGNSPAMQFCKRPAAGINASLFLLKSVADSSEAKVK